MEPVRIDLEQLSASASAGGRIDLPIGLTATELLIGLTAAAVRETASDLELLLSVPARDDAQFGDGPRPTEVTELSAWLYSASNRVAYAVHTSNWTPPSTAPDPTSDPVPTSDPDQSTEQAAWSALLREHLHGDFHAGRGWTPVNAVAMPVRKPFDESGLRIVPLLALWPSVSQHANDWFSETMTATVFESRPQVVAVRVFSAAAYLRRLTASGQRWFELTAADRRPTLVGQLTL